MPIDPDDLLIFKKRKENVKEESGNEKKPQNEPVQQTVPPKQSSVPLKPELLVSKTSIPQTKAQKAISPPTQTIIPTKPQSVKPTEKVKTKGFLFKKAITKPYTVPSQSTSSTQSISSTQQTDITKSMPNSVSALTTKAQKNNSKQTQHKGGGRGLFLHGKNIDKTIEHQISQEALLFNPQKDKTKIDLAKSLFTEEEMITTPNLESTNNKKKEKREKENVADFYCVNHPWRKAFAFCEYCHRPFCFADLTKNEGKYYCLEDIDEVIRIPTTKTNKHQIYNYLAGLVLFMSVGIILYNTYPQVHYSLFNIINTVKSIGVVSFIKTINLSYLYTLQNSFLVLFGIISGLLLFFRNNKATILSVLLLVVMTMAVSYNYLDSNVYYLLYTFVLYVLSISLIAVGKMSNIGSASISEATEGIEWPKFETF